MNKQLNKLLRMNKGKAMLESYEALFIASGFKKEDLFLIKLDDSDKIIEQMRNLVPAFKYDNELISANVTDFRDSELLLSIYNKYNESTCYVYTYAYEYCGMYDVPVNQAFNYILNLALNDAQHTCFLIDKTYNYTFTINYYNSDHIDEANKFDVQRRMALP